MTQESQMMVVALLFGLSVWYLYYGIECAINGGMLGRRYPRLDCLREEITWILPGGYAKKLRHCGGNRTLADTLPGIPHFIGIHVLLPFGPVIYTLIANW